MLTNQGSNITELTSTVYYIYYVYSLIENGIAKCSMDVSLTIKNKLLIPINTVNK